MFRSSINWQGTSARGRILPLFLICLWACGCESPESLTQSPSEPSPIANVDQTEVELSSVANAKLIEANRNRAFAKLPAGTAEEYLAKFDDPNKQFTRIRLTPAEAKKAADGLRDRFPLVSIRDRMHFQQKEPSLVYPQGWPNMRSASLAELHSENVDAFINREGEGITRIPDPSPLYIRPSRSEYVTKIITEPVGSMLLSEPVVQLDPKNKTRGSRAKMDEGKDVRVADPEYYNQLSSNGLPKKQLVSRFNDVAAWLFSQSNLEYVKSLDEVAGFEHHQLKMPSDWKQNLRSKLTEFDETAPSVTNWKVNQLQLISLLMHKQPIVYVTDELPNMETLSSETAETRSLTAFETDGLDKLQAGESLHIQATQNRIVMIGAIRADAACCQCHAVETGSLLGAFSYEFLRSPRVEE